MTDRHLLAAAAIAYVADHSGQVAPLADMIDAVADLSGTDAARAKRAVFWLIDNGLARFTSTFLVEVT